MKRDPIGTCTRCGRVIPWNDACGYDGDKLLCHPDDPSLPDCYHPETVYGPQRHHEVWGWNG